MAASGTNLASIGYHFGAGLGRAGAWLTVGKPHPLQRALLAIELAAPPLVVLEHARLRSTAPEAQP